MDIKFLFNNMTLDMFLRRVGPVLRDILLDQDSIRQDRSARFAFKSVKSYIQRMHDSRVFRDRSVFSALYKGITAVDEVQDLRMSDDLLDYLDALKDFFNLINVGEFDGDLSSSPILFSALQRLYKFTRTIDLRNRNSMDSNMFSKMQPNEFLVAATALTGVIPSIKKSGNRAAAAASTISAMQNYLETSYERNSFSNSSGLGVLRQALDYNSEDTMPVLTEVNAVEYIDYIHDFLEQLQDSNNDDDEDDDNNDSFQAPVNMSRDLLRLFGKREGYEFSSGPTNYDWVAPRSHGLTNSEPILKKPHDHSIGHVTSSQKTGYWNEGSSQPKPSASNTTNGRFDHKSTPADDDEDDDDDEDNDGEDDEDDDSYKRGDSDNDDEDDADYDSKFEAMSSNMSASLKRALGLAVDEEVETKWKPPAFSGLDNSDAIVKKPTSTINPRIEGKHTDSETEDEEDDDDDDDDDEDEDDEDDDDEDIAKKILESGGGMSASLRRALGLDCDDVATDWRPPSFSGLDNSSKLI